MDRWRACGAIGDAVLRFDFISVIINYPQPEPPPFSGVYTYLGHLSSRRGYTEVHPDPLLTYQRQVM